MSENQNFDKEFRELSEKLEKQPLYSALLLSSIVTIYIKEYRKDKDAKKLTELSLMLNIILECIQDELSKRREGKEE